MKTTLKVEVSGSGSSSATHTLDAEAFDKVTVSVPAESGGTAGSLEVDVQPGGSGQVELLLLTADSYSTRDSDGASNEELSFTVGTSTDEIVLDAPLLLLGPGATALLGTDLTKMTFSNDLATAVDIEILVGRDATPPPSS